VSREPAAEMLRMRAAARQEGPVLPALRRQAAARAQAWRAAPAPHVLFL
jgi:hypothetical protein